MSEPIYLYSAIYVTSLVLIGLLLTMREFSRESRAERLKVSKVKHADRLREARTFGYVPGYSGA
jgi:uncharacterized protein (UPF0212 family)